MAPSIADIPDHYLWLGLGNSIHLRLSFPSLTPPGVFTFIAIKQVSAGLSHIRSVTEIRRSPRPTQTPHHLPRNPTHQEDAIKTSSLLTLATSPNVDIRQSATRILCQRFYANSTARKLLIRDLNSKDEDIKRRAQLAFDLLCDHDVIALPTPTPREGWRLHEPMSSPALRQNTTEDSQDLRRRRREAVVIHDGDIDRPIGEEDVYMRGEAEIANLDREFNALMQGGGSNSDLLPGFAAQLAESNRRLREELEDLEGRRMREQRRTRRSSELWQSLQ
jgi:hypothetical protein